MMLCLIINKNEFEKWGKIWWTIIRLFLLSYWRGVENTWSCHAKELKHWLTVKGFTIVSMQDIIHPKSHQKGKRTCDRLVTLLRRVVILKLSFISSCAWLTCFTYLNYVLSIVRRFPRWRRRGQTINGECRNYTLKLYMYCPCWVIGKSSFPNIMKDLCLTETKCTYSKMLWFFPG